MYQFRYNNLVTTKYLSSTMPFYRDFNRITIHPVDRGTRNVRQYLSFLEASIMGKCVMTIMVSAPTVPCAPIHGLVPWSSWRLLARKLAVRRGDGVFANSHTNSVRAALAR